MEHGKDWKKKEIVGQTIKQSETRLKSVSKVTRPDTLDKKNTTHASRRLDASCFVQGRSVRESNTATACGVYGRWGSSGEYADEVSSLCMSGVHGLKLPDRWFKACQQWIFKRGECRALTIAPIYSHYFDLLTHARMHTCIPFQGNWVMNDRPVMNLWAPGKWQTGDCRMTLVTIVASTWIPCMSQRGSFPLWAAYGGRGSF